MARLVHTFTAPLTDPAGMPHLVQAWGEQREDGLWEGRLLFLPVDGGISLVTGRETTQSNLDAIAYWANGLEAVYLEGALGRAVPFDGRRAAA